jgi:hypothetical protein
MMSAHIAAPAPSRFTSRLAVTIATAVLLSGTSFQSAWAQTAPTLGSAKSFAVLGASTVTNTGSSTIQGDLGVYAGTAITGFPPGVVIGGTIHAADAAGLDAQRDALIAYTFLSSEGCTLDLTGHDLGGLTLTKGVYCFSSSAGLTGTLTLDAQGDPNAVFIFRMGSTLTTASSSQVRLINSAQPCNIFWQVGSSATLGTHTAFIGNILAVASITATTGASVNGRLLAQTAAVTLDTNHIAFSSCAIGTTSGGDTGAIPPIDTPPGTPPVGVPGPVCTDTKAPIVTWLGAITGLHTRFPISVKDAGAGLASIVVTANDNLSVAVPIFAPGTKSVVVTGTKLDETTEYFTFGVLVTDLCGNVTAWDPVQFRIDANDTVTVGGIYNIEHWVTITNDGLQALSISINGEYATTVWLTPNATRLVNIGRWMAPGNENIITFEAFGFGRRRASAVILVHPK